MNSKTQYSSVVFFFFSQFLQDTLDTLFGILDESSQRYGLKVFDSLVSITFKSSDQPFVSKTEQGFLNNA